MKVNFEMTVDEVLSIKSRSAGGTVINGYRFCSFGDGVVDRDKLDEEIKSGKSNKVFLLLQKIFNITNNIPEIFFELVEVHVVKAHAIENYPPAEQVNFTVPRIQDEQ